MTPLRVRSSSTFPDRGLVVVAAAGVVFSATSKGQKREFRTLAVVHNRRESAET